MSDPESRRRLVHARLEEGLERDADGAPLLSPLFVLRQGPDVHVVDLCPVEDAGGALGHISG